MDVAIPFVCLVILLILGIPIGFALGGAGMLGIWIVKGNWDVVMATLKAVPFNTVGDYNLTTIPMFVLMAFFSSSSGLARDLYTAASNWLSHIRGGLAIATVFACGIFGAMSGASVAAAAVMANVAIPNMRRYGYSEALAAGAVGRGINAHDPDPAERAHGDLRGRHPDLHRRAPHCGGHTRNRPGNPSCGLHCHMGHNQPEPRPRDRAHAVAPSVGGASRVSGPACC